MWTTGVQGFDTLPNGVIKLPWVSCLVRWPVPGGVPGCCWMLNSGHKGLTRRAGHIWGGHFKWKQRVFFFCKIVKQQLKLSIKQWFFVMENGFISVLWTVLWTNCETTLNTVLMDSNHVETAVISKLSISIISHGTNWETWDMESLRLYGLFLPMVKWLTSESGWSIYGDITWYDWYIMIGGW